MLNAATTHAARSRPPLLNGPRADSTRPLNAADRCLMAVDRTIRRLGGPGFETQTFIWLSERIDACRLAARIASLGEPFPLITARLIEQGGPYWRLRPAAAVTLVETRLNSADPQAVLDEAASLLSAPSNPAEVDPVRFHL